MKISVVTASFNYSRFIVKALESVLAQVKDSASLEVEHIVVDGASTDGTPAQLAEWEKRVNAVELSEAGARYTFRWVSEPDKGQTDAINKGLRMATGDVVCWLNADEYYLPGALDKVAAAFGKNQKIDFIYGEPLYVDLEDKPIRVKRDHPFSGFVLLWYGCYIASCCSFWRRRILDDGVFLDDTYKVVMDGEYWVRIMKLGYRFKFLPTTIAAFTWHDTNISTVYNDKRLEESTKIKMLYAPMVFSSSIARKYIRKAMRFTAIQWRRLLVVLRLIFRPLDKHAGVGGRGK